MSLDDAEEKISAYATLWFEGFKFWVQTLHFTLGRKASRADFVDVHLGSSKSISRKHVNIYYQFSTSAWEIEVLGKNGAFVNDQYVACGERAALKDNDRICIGETPFFFLLSDGAMPQEGVSPSVNPFETIVEPGKALTATDLNATSTALASRVQPTPVAPRDLMQNVSGSLTASNTATTPSAAAAGTKKVSGDQSKQLNANKLSNNMQQNQISTIDSPYGEISAQKKTDTSNAQHQYTASWSLNTMTAGDGNTLSRIGPDGLYLPADSMQAKTEEERRLQEEENEAQLKAQLAHQERLARQAREEEEGLILPPAESDPAIIASFQKPTASYATMIYNAITSHEKKKMTLAQIYSWICINHPYYRYVQNGWQNSIRHNLSLNKAFVKVFRTDDEPGKGAFWAVDPESEMLFEGGVYKKKPPRPTPSAPSSRGAPVVMKDGKFALNPNYFATGIQGKAEEVLEMLEAAVQRQLGQGNHEDEASQLARILALALATQLRQSAVANNSMRPQQTVMTPQRLPAPTMPTNTPRYTPTQLPGPQRPMLPNTAARPMPMQNPAGNSVPMVGNANRAQANLTKPASITPVNAAGNASTPYAPSTSNANTASKPNYAPVSGAIKPSKPYQPYQAANSSLPAALARSQAAGSATAPIAVGAQASSTNPIPAAAGKPVAAANTAVSATNTAGTAVKSVSPANTNALIAPPSTQPQTTTPGTTVPTVSTPVGSNTPAVGSSSANAGTPKALPVYTPGSLLNTATYKKPSIGPAPGPVRYTRTPLPGSTPVVYNRTPLPQSTTLLQRGAAQPKAATVHKAVTPPSTASATTPRVTSVSTGPASALPAKPLPQSGTLPRQVQQPAKQFSPGTMVSQQAPVVGPRSLTPAAVSAPAAIARTTPGPALATQHQRPIVGPPSAVSSPIPFAGKVQPSTPAGIAQTNGLPKIAATSQAGPASQAQGATTPSVTAGAAVQSANPTPTPAATSTTTTIKPAIPSTVKPMAQTASAASAESSVSTPQTPASTITINTAQTTLMNGNNKRSLEDGQESGITKMQKSEPSSITTAAD